jgi:large subunit ribosomal protein L4
MYRAGMASILSQLVREDRWRWSTAVDRSSEDEAVCPKIKGMGYDSVLVITDDLDENVFLAARNLPNVLVLEVSRPTRCR